MKPIKFLLGCIFFCVHAMGQLPALNFDRISVSTIAPRSQFQLPLLGPVDAAGNIYMAINNTISRRNSNGTVTVIAGTAGIGGYVDGPALTAQFSTIEDIGMDAAGNIYVSDAGNSSIRKITPGGMVSTLAGNGTPGYQDGTGTGARFTGPAGMTLDAAGNIYVLANYSIRKITAAGVVSTVYGNGSANPQINSPTGLEIDAAGNFYVDNIYGDLLKITSSGIVSNHLPPGYFGFKQGLAIDKSGNLYISILNPGVPDTYIVYKNSQGGDIAALAGGVAGYRDTIGLDARFNSIRSLSIDDKDNIYVSDEAGIRKMGKPVLHFAGNAGIPSQPQYFTISGNYLAAAATLQAPAGYELSLSESGPYAASLAIAPINGEIMVRKVYLRLRAGNSAGVYNDSIVLSAAGSITQKLGVSGSVSNSPRKLVIIGSGTSACISLDPVTECYVGLLSTQYNKQAPFDTVIDDHLARGSTNCYNGMPSSYISPYPAGSAYRPLTDINITAALLLNPDVVLVNYPTNGYDELSINEVMFCLRTIRDSAKKKGVPCFITTTQPRTSPASFNTPAMKLKLAVLKDSIQAAFGSYAIDFWTGLINPADSSVLYNLGDNINMNAAGHAILAQRVAAKNIFSAPVSPTGAGTGLQGTYYNNRVFYAPAALSRIDPVINFDFAGMSPAPGTVNATDYAVRWTGRVAPLFSETYTFYALADDGVRLWVNGVQLIDNWTGPVPGERSGTIALEAGQHYDIVMEYYQAAGNAVCKLSWSSANTPKAVIPSAQLYPIGPLPPSLPACATNNTPANGATLATTSSATLTWSPVAQANSYYVFLWTGTTVPAVPYATVNTSSLQLTGLSASTVYNWYVLPRNDFFVATGCGIANKSSFTTAAVTAAAGTGLKGDYFDGIALSGTPLLTRADTTINFELTYSMQPQVFSPAPGIVPVDFYSVRWTGQVQALYSEMYTFYTVSDDGVRLWVNGQLLIDNWVNQGATEKSGTINLVAGQKYDIKIEYYENTGESVTKLYWSSASTPKALVPKLYLFPAGAVISPVPGCAVNIAPVNGATIGTINTATLSWSPVAGATVYYIYLWTGDIEPTIPFGVSSTSSYAVTGGLYSSTLYKWYVVPKNDEFTATGCGTANRSSFTTASFQTGAGSGLKGEYFNGITLSGSPLLTRTDTTINFELTYSRQPQVFSPAPGIVPEDLYSVRWTGQVEAIFSGTYTFYTVSDDGVRLWVNGQLLVDNWVNQGATEKSGTINLAAGQRYDIKIEYYENTGESVTKLYWSGPGISKVIIPKAQLYPPTAGARWMDNTLTNTGPVAAQAGISAVSFAAGLYPNPVKSGQSARLQISSSKAGTAVLSIMSSTGHSISSRTVGLAAGINTVNVSTTGLAQGLYMVNVKGTGKPVTLKLAVE